MRRPKPVKGPTIIYSPEMSSSPIPEMDVIGTTNPGVTTFEENGQQKIALFVRKTLLPNEEKILGKRRRSPEHKLVLAPYFDVQDAEGSPFKISWETYKAKDLIKVNGRDIELPDGTFRLRHISYFEKVIMDEKGNIERVEPSTLAPEFEHERFGMEDLRITKMEKDNEINYRGQKFRYVATYPVPHRGHRVDSAIALSNDLAKWTKVSENPNVKPRPIIVEKDAIFFPEYIPTPNVSGDLEDHLWILDRRSSFQSVSPPDIGVSHSPDLISWSRSKKVLQSQQTGIKGQKVTGTGPAPKKFEKEGLWVAPFHAITTFSFGDVYRTALLGLDIENPTILKYKTRPFISPDEHDREDSFVEHVNYVMGFELIDNGKHTLIVCGENDRFVSMRVYSTKLLLRYLKG
jgi:predicted GH43/DUF377 family glycosyl hydrolase